MAGEERGEGILVVVAAECREERTGERPREGATLGKRVGEGGGSCGMMGNLGCGSRGEESQFRRGYGM